MPEAGAPRLRSERRLSFTEFRVTDVAGLATDRARGEEPRLRSRARGDDRRHVRPDAAGDGRAARHAPARPCRLRAHFAASVAKCSTPTTRSRAVTGSKSARPASTGRLPASRIIATGRGTKRASRSSSRRRPQAIFGDLEGLEGELSSSPTRTAKRYAVAFSDIASAKLLLTDKLIKATAPLSTEGADAIKMEG